MGQEQIAGRKLHRPCACRGCREEYGAAPPPTRTDPLQKHCPVSPDIECEKVASLPCGGLTSVLICP